MQAKVLRTLQYFPLPEGTLAQRQLHDTLVAIFNREYAHTMHNASARAAQIIGWLLLWFVAPALLQQHPVQLEPCSPVVHMHAIPDGQQGHCCVA